MVPSVNIKNLIFKYGSNIVLKDVSLSVQPGNFIGIIGPNGSGKSTLLKNISGILKPSEGSIQLDGQDISKMKSKDIARKLSVVPQENNIEYRFSVLDIVMMGRSPYLRRFQAESIQDYKITKKAMELTDTWKLKDRIINELSGGEKQRVVIARALTQEPEVILLDEPTSYLDIQHQIEILELLKKLNREKGLTVILVLHDINLAIRFSDNLILLKEGKIVAEGKSEEVITHEILKEAYNIDVAISKNPHTKSLYVIPLKTLT